MTEDTIMGTATQHHLDAIQYHFSALMDEFNEQKELTDLANQKIAELKREQQFMVPLKMETSLPSLDEAEQDPTFLQNVSMINTEFPKRPVRMASNIPLPGKAIEMTADDLKAAMERSPAVFQRKSETPAAVKSREEESAYIAKITKKMNGDGWIRDEKNAELLAKFGVGPGPLVLTKPSEDTTT